MSKRSRISKRPGHRFGHRAAILLPISALPSPYGIGDFGPVAHRYIAWLGRTGLAYWQILPLTIPDSVGSPYAPPSMMAGNWMHISPERLREQGWLPATGWGARSASAAPISYRRVRQRKIILLRRAYAKFLSVASPLELRAWQSYVHKQRRWLEPAAWFFAAKDAHRGKPWWRWPHGLQSWPLPASAQSRLRRRYEFHTWLQWVFDTQWRDLRRAAHLAGIHIIGDIPFAPPLDSVEIWSQPELFLLNKHKRPTAVLGVPPDPFSKRGQRWGTPAYHWTGHRRQGWRWWYDRFRLARDRYDLIRFDHFRGLIATWHIPARSRNPQVGRWVASPQRPIWRQVRRGFRRQIIAEDLGHYSKLEERLRRLWHIDGMRVWQFGWSGLPNNLHDPNNVPSDTFYYSSIHDTNTTSGWWHDEAKWYEQHHVRRAARQTKAIHLTAIDAVMASAADVAVVPMQDWLGLGTSSRLNRPGRVRGNWQWRVPEKYLQAALAKKIHRTLQAHGRSA